MEVAFRSSEIAFFKVSFILAGGKGFSINYKLCAFIRSVFLLVTTMLEIKCNLTNFLGFFLFLTAEAVFPASGNEFFIECFIPVSGHRFSAWCSFIQSKFCASGNHYSNQGKAIFYRVTSLLVLETIFYGPF